MEACEWLLEKFGKPERPETLEVVPDLELLSRTMRARSDVVVVGFLLIATLRGDFGLPFAAGFIIDFIGFFTSFSAYDYVAFGSFASLVVSSGFSYWFLKFEIELIISASFLSRSSLS